MNKVMLYLDYKAVGFDITAALIRAVGMEDVPLVADGRHRAMDGMGRIGTHMARKGCLIQRDQAAFCSFRPVDYQIITVS